MVSAEPNTRAKSSADHSVALFLFQVRDLEADEKGLDAKIKRKQAELERSEKRLKSLQSMRPPFMDEYEKLEKDLVVHYEG